MIRETVMVIIWWTARPEVSLGILGGLAAFPFPGYGSVVLILPGTLPLCTTGFCDVMSLDCVVVEPVVDIKVPTGVALACVVEVLVVS